MFIEIFVDSRESEQRWRVQIRRDSCERLDRDIKKSWPANVVNSVLKLLVLGNFGNVL